MTKAELIEDIAKRADLDRALARRALEATIEAVTAALKTGQEVRLVGFGSFTPVSRPAGLARNPRTGAQVRRKACRTVRFRIGEGLKSAVN
ncbi:MAG: HU family DNA-binding protein [Caulobacteraceae bacterium]|nr:HU family DNA-binding protein [Caulobacteraceae bacterium]